MSTDEDSKISVAFAQTDRRNHLKFISPAQVQAHDTAKDLSAFAEAEELLPLCNALGSATRQFMAISQKGTPKADLEVLKPLLKVIFPGMGGDKQGYKPVVYSDSNTAKVSSSMVAATVHLRRGRKINVVCNQFYHGNRSDDPGRCQCQRMLQSAFTARANDITIILDFPRQPASVRKLAIVGANKKAKCACAVSSQLVVSNSSQQC